MQLPATWPGGLAPGRPMRDPLTMEPALIESVRAASERLARRLERREAHRVDVSTCSGAVPDWWRQGLAEAAVFGDGLLSLPSYEPDTFSRPVAFLSAAEITTTAGGEYVPLAWMDGGKSVAVVRDRGALPVIAAAMDHLSGPISGDAPGDELLADSLVEFLDALRPQTVCRFVAPGDERAIELQGELALLIEQGGAVALHHFESDKDVGERVASFVIEALDAGMQVAFSPARLRQLIAARQRAPADPEIPPEVRAAAAIRRLLDKTSLELVPPGSRDPDEQIEDLIDAAARFLEKNQRRRNIVKAFAEWLAQHDEVDDLYADDDAVRDALTALAHRPER